MDDDADDPDCMVPRKAPRTPKQYGYGNYSLPEAGICWVWKRSSKGMYSGFSVRDLGANRDLCIVHFQTAVKAASTVRGRRDNTILPTEDRFLLKEECSTSVFGMQIVGGTAFEQVCLKSTCYLADVESSLRMRCPWDIEDMHRLEIYSSTQKVRGTANANKDETRYPNPSSDSMVISGSTQPHMSEIQTRIGIIMKVLEQLNQQDALAHLQQVVEWLTVAILEN